MKQRVITGVLLILLLVVLLWLPGWCMALATLIAIGFATWEEYHALTLAEHRPFQKATGNTVARTDTKTRVVEQMPHRLLMAETDEGRAA